MAASGAETDMGYRNGCVLALIVAGALTGCQTERGPLPVMSVTQWEALPPAQKPTVFRDPDPLLPYPYNIHETDGLSRNPDDCVRCGCVDVNYR
jgi:hypothetical protein